MKVKVINKNSKGATKEKQARITKLVNVNGTPCLVIEGSFKPIYLSSRKAKALIQCLQGVKEFADGAYDEQVAALGADEFLSVEA